MNKINNYSNTFILHIDMRNYFASVEMINDSSLNNIPFCVTGDPSFRHGIILSKNEEAKKYNIITGESLFSAKNKCKILKTKVANYHLYYSYTLKIREIFKRYTKFVFPYSLDEAWLDISNYVENITEAKFTALKIKNEIKNELNLDCAIGLSFNFVFSKLGSDMKLENDCFVIDYDNYINITNNIPLFKMLMVGEKTRNILKKMDILTIGDLRKANEYIIKQKLGKKGIELYNFSYGNDLEFQSSIKEDQIKSLGNTITLPNDIDDYNDVSKFIYYICYIISKRLKNHQLVTSQISLLLKYNDFSTSNHQKSFNLQTNDYKILNKFAQSILNEYFNTEKKLRAIGIRVMNLNNNKNNVQLSLFENEDNDDSEMNYIQKSLRNKYKSFELNI